ncbi:hypothetical protein SDC9_176195 [bioreactor metagenome]|uniref:Uncharacterized protein n=1 Tax=bioreactor metagenome TaxID=1076179 RepID=A0A645GR88_9ZZZZ
MGNDLPALLQMWTRNLLDAGELPALGLPVLGEVLKLNLAEGGRSSAQAAECFLHQSLDILMQDPPIGSTALHPCKIDSQLPCVGTQRRRRVVHSTRRLLIDEVGLFFLCHMYRLLYFSYRFWFFFLLRRFCLLFFLRFLRLLFLWLFNRHFFTF